MVNAARPSACKRYAIPHEALFYDGHIEGSMNTSWSAESKEIVFECRSQVPCAISTHLRRVESTRLSTRFRRIVLYSDFGVLRCEILTGKETSRMYVHSSDIRPFAWRGLETHNDSEPQVSIEELIEAASAQNLSYCIGSWSSREISKLSQVKYRNSCSVVLERRH